jgi:serine/threonine kinase 38
MEELNLSEKEKEMIKKDVFHREAEYLRLKRKKLSIREFESIAIIGRGAFGEVRVCRHIETGDIVAIKKMRKDDMMTKNQNMHVITEKIILTSAKIPWIVNLKYAFQDETYLYLVMDFLAGGDLMTLLMKKDILTEDEAKFYIAELILAVESVHNMNGIHRDLKPDNILIDKKGHIQLSDFGLSKLADQSFYPMSIDLPNEDELTVHKPSGIVTDSKMSKVDIKSKRKNRLVNFYMIHY